MGQEILYTSAPQGLRSGASGFCTVCSTAGMEPNLAEFLEGFSGYPHPFKPPDPRTAENPINYSHVLWTIGGQRYSVLSRVSDAGLDHTGRTNLLAHHVALPEREAERCKGGPAWVLADAGFAIEKWDGQLRTLQPKTPVTTDCPLGECVAWKKATGDAGYAGVLAESVKDKGGRPVVIIYPSNLKTLPLLVEALSLLPPEKRWSVTFATLYSRIYSSFDCQWRFVFHESAEARTARRDPQALVLDLTKGDLPPAKGGELVTLAREGKHAQAAPAAASSRQAAAVAAAPPRTRRGEAPPPVPLENGDLRVAPPIAPAGVSHSLPPAEPAINPFAKSSARRSATWLPVGLAFFGGIALTLVVFIVMVMNQKPAATIAANHNPSPPPNRQITAPTPVEKPSVVAEDPTARPRPSETVVVPVDPTPAPEPTPQPNDPPPEQPATTVPNQVAAVTPIPAKVAPSNPFADIVERRRLLKLPQRGATSSLTSPKTAASGGPIAEVYVSTAAQCDLAIENRELAFDKATAGLIELERSDKGSQRTWTVIRQPHGTLAKKVTLARFVLDKQKLTFAWDAAPGIDPSVTESLRLCTLRLTVGDESISCQMSEPVILDALDFQKGHLALADFPFRNLKVTDPGALALRVQAQGFKSHLEPAALPALKPEETTRFLVFKDGPVAGPVIGILAEFLWPGSSEEPKNGDARAIRSVAIIGYKEEGIPAEECLKAQYRKLSLDEIDSLIKEKTASLKQLDINAIRAHNDFKTKQEAGKQELDRIKMQINQINRKLEELKGKEKEEAEGRKKKLQEHKENVDAAIDTLRKAAEEKRQFHDNAQAIVKRGKEIREFAEKVIANGKLEFQLVLTRNGDSVVLCQSRGFRGEKEF